MSKQPSTGIKKILAVLLAAFFVVSLSAVSVPLQKIWLFYKTSERHHKSDIYIPQTGQ